MTDHQNLDAMVREALPHDPYRLQYHFATPTGWMNDPNGLIYCNGEYHLFYQHHPDSLVWGPMHWGHAVSRDLLYWQDLPIALAPDDLGTIFSGSAVIDHQNTAGFGAGAMVAVFTHDRAGSQSQSLAYSVDQGRTWSKYANNPVLTPPENTPDFRDPKVFWYTDGSSGHWVMLLAVGRSIWIYCSPNLKQWQKTAELTGRGASGGVWECPDLLMLPVDGGPQSRWVLVVSVQQGAPAGGSGVQYFVGDFDGQRFIPEEQPDVVRWADYGADFYAVQSWNEAPIGRHLWLAWMNNWDYARQTPATTWRGAMTLPRELSLANDGAGIQLIQQPIIELVAMRNLIATWNDIALAPGENPLAAIHGVALDLVVRFAVDHATTTANRFGVRVRVGAHEQTTVAYDVASSMLSIDRSHAVQQIAGLAAVQELALPPRNGIVELQILVDRSSIEVFADGGRTAFTNQIFLELASQGVELFAEGGSVQIQSLDVYRLAQP